MLDQLVINSGYGAVVGYSAKTISFNVALADRGKIFDVDTSGGNVTVTQLAAATAGAGFSYIIRKSTSDANTVSLGTVDGGAKTLTKINEGRLIVSTGAAYISETWQDPTAVAITGGTAALSTLSLTGQLTSTLAIGTAPFVITSTTLVTNLNAGLLGGQAGSFYTNAGNLNAGTILAARMPAFTGDVTTVAGNVANTLATVNANVGSFTFSSITVNNKGLITAASSGTVAATVYSNPAPAGTNNESFGLSAGASLAGGSSINAAFGYLALNKTTTGNSNSAFGSSALLENLVGTGNAMLGISAGQRMVGSSNTALGGFAMRGSGTPANNTGGSNVAIGYNSMTSVAGGGSNIAIGASALNALTTPSFNVAVGDSALTLSTTAADNVAIGASAMSNILTSAENVAVGFFAMANMVSIATGSNVAVGSNALLGSVTPGNNTGDRNIAIGFNAMKAATTASSNVGVGNTALTAITTGANNVAIGASALIAATTISGSVAVGAGSLFAVTSTDVQATAVGYNTLLALTTGLRNCAFGYNAGSGLTTGNDNVAIGYNALLQCSTKDGNVAVGGYALQGVTTTDVQSTAVGYYALKLQSNGTNNVAVGGFCGQAITSGSRNVGMGRQALNVLTSQSDNVCLGDAAMSGSRGSQNVAIGSSAFIGAGTAAGGSNTIIGYSAVGGSNNTTAADNTSVGRQTLNNLTTGSANLALGSRAGYNVTTGGNACYIGDTTQDATAYAINTVVIDSSNADGAVFTKPMRISGVLTLQSRVRLNRVTFSNAAYNMSATDGYIAQVGVMSASRVVNLVSASSYGTGGLLTIADESGTAGAVNTIVVTRNGADTINGGTTSTILTAYGVRTLISDGTSAWTVLQSL